MTLIARLRIILNDVEPMPMRHIEVPLKIRLDRLHEVIQAAMGWTDTHLYEFRVGDAGWGEPDPDGIYDGPMDAKKITLESCSTRPPPGRSSMSTTSVMTGTTASGSSGSTRPPRA